MLKNIGGAVLVLSGIIVLVFGSKKINIKKSSLIESLELKKRSHLVKVVLGVILIWFGATLLFDL